jgi:hypothetical protein
MSNSFATFLLMNNYFHDVATAMLLACCVVLWVLLRRLGDERDAALRGYVRSLYRGIAGIFRFSVAWIIVSGVIRLATLQSFEWVNAGRGGFTAGLLAKYAIAACMMIAGIVLWSRLTREMKDRLNG